MDKTLTAAEVRHWDAALGNLAEMVADILNTQGDTARLVKLIDLRDRVIESLPANARTVQEQET